MGGLVALNPLNNNKQWYIKEKWPVSGGFLTTSSNLLFYGTMDRWFKVLYSNSGKLLWKFQVGSGVIGNSFSYFNKGKHYVGAFSGIGGAWANEAIGQGWNMINDRTSAYEDTTLQQFARNNANIGAGALNIFSL